MDVIVCVFRVKVCVCLRQIVDNGAVARDGRLTTGQRILEVIVNEIHADTHACT